LSVSFPLPPQTRARRPWHRSWLLCPSSRNRTIEESVPGQFGGHRLAIDPDTAEGRVEVSLRRGGEQSHDDSNKGHAEVALGLVKATAGTAPTGTVPVKT
jgi:hypothetical protein